MSVSYSKPLFFCAAVLAATIVPLEQPQASSENWQKTKNTTLCVDIDSVETSNDVMTWHYKKCGTSAVFEGRLNLNDNIVKAKSFFTWETRTATGDWAKRSARHGAPEYEMIADVLIDQMVNDREALTH